MSSERLPVQTAETAGRGLYAQSAKIYPREIGGRFARLRTLAVWLLLGIFYVVPWVVLDGRQMVLFDLPARKFYILWLSFFPQDFMYLTFFLIIAALSLFFFTALAGRLWCGYACPQTVWTEVFLWIERRIEGDRAKRVKLDKAPMSTRKFALKAAKHGVWILFSLWTGFTFVGFFTPIYDLGARFFEFALGPWETFWIAFYAFATYGNAGWMREQVCTYMCPYARFQSAMFDRDTMIIAYDRGRGEQRGSRKRGEDYQARGLGDCIDCTMCVQVCPTGIDIRDGLQYQCIGCAACIDACDEVMDKVGYPKGLVRYTTENAVEGNPTRVLRTRTVIYAALLATLTAIVFGSLMMRIPLALDVLRDRNALYRDTREGLIENIYTLKLINMDRREHAYGVELSGLEGATLLLQHSDLRVPAGEVRSVAARVRMDPADLKRSNNPLTFVLRSLDDPSLEVSEEARFIGPPPGR